MQMKKSLLTMLALLSMGSSSFAQGTVKVPTVNRTAGDVKEVSVVASRQGKVKIELQNNADYRDLQFDITLPEGITLADETNGGSVAIETDRAVGFATQTTAGVVRFVLYSETGAKLSNNILLEIPVKAAQSFSGTQAATLTNVITSNDAAETSIAIAQGDFNFRAVVLGDVTDDGNVDMADAQAMVSFIFNNIPAIFVEEAGDVEENNLVDMADAQSLVSKIFAPSAKQFVKAVEDNELDPE